VTALIGPLGRNNFLAPCAAPLAVVVGFKDGRSARVEAVAVNPFCHNSRSGWVSRVEVEVSTTDPFAGFRSVGVFDVPAVGDVHVFPLPRPESARHVRFTFLDVHRLPNQNASCAAAQLQVLGRLLTPAEAPAAVEPVNVAARANGGAVVSACGELADWCAAGCLVDGSPGRSWVSKSDGPQTVVVRLGRPALVRAIAINPYSTQPIDDWAREAEVSLSDVDAESGFRPVGTLRLPALGRDAALVLPEPVAARFVRVVFTRNGGGGHVTANEIKVYAAD
jgi:hypothetical protein